MEEGTMLAWASVRECHPRLVASAGVGQQRVGIAEEYKQGESATDERRSGCSLVAAECDGREHEPSDGRNRRGGKEKRNVAVIPGPTDSEERRTRNAECRGRPSGVVTVDPHVTCRRHR